MFFVAFSPASRYVDRPTRSSTITLYHNCVSGRNTAEDYKYTRWRNTAHDKGLCWARLRSTTPLHYCAVSVSLFPCKPIRTERVSATTPCLTTVHDRKMVLKQLRKMPRNQHTGANTHDDHAGSQQAMVPPYFHFYHHQTCFAAARLGTIPRKPPPMSACDPRTRGSIDLCRSTVKLCGAFAVVVKISVKDAV